MRNFILLYPIEPKERTIFLTDAISTDHFLLSKVIEEAELLGFPLFIVGGFVRDLLLGFPAADLDLVVEGDAVRLTKNLIMKYGGEAIFHHRFKTARWILPEFQLGSGRTALDLISSRAESYKSPAALPTVRQGNLADDLNRRDFTINTLAIRLDGKNFGELRDNLDGIADLIHGRIRALHPNSFKDDPTRLFRAIRYAERYGFTITPETKAQIPLSLNFIPCLSAERLRHELDLIMEEEVVAGILLRLSKLDILSRVHPLLTWNSNISKRMKKVTEVPAEERQDFAWMFLLMDLSSSEIEQVDSRLHFTTKLRRSILGVSKLWADREELINKTPSQCVDLLEEIPENSIRAVYLSSIRGELKNILHNYIELWRYVKPKTSGAYLKRLGLEPGPNYKIILRHLRSAWLEGEVTSEVEEKLLLDRLIRVSKY